MKGEIEVFAPSLLSVLFPGNASLHGGKQKVCSSGSGGSHYTSSLSSSLVLQRKLLCYCMCNNTVMRYNKLHIMLLFVTIMESNYGVTCTIRKTDTPSMVIQ